MRYLCFDIGDKRTGIAAGDDSLRLAGPLAVIHSTTPENLITQLLTLIKREGVTALVIGLPLNMDDSEGPQAKKVRDLGNELAERLTSCTIHYHDERLTSFAADEKMARTGLTHAQKKARRDALAATAILQDFLDNLKID